MPQPPAEATSQLPIGPALQNVLAHHVAPSQATRNQKTLSPTQTSFLFLFRHLIVLIFVAFLVHPGEFERFSCDYFILDAALIADNDVPFFNFIGIEIENALTFLTNWHTALLSRSIKMLMMPQPTYGLASFRENLQDVKALPPRHQIVPRTETKFEKDCAPAPPRDASLVLGSPDPLRRLGCGSCACLRGADIESACCFPS